MNSINSRYKSEQNLNNKELQEMIDLCTLLWKISKCFGEEMKLVNSFAIENLRVLESHRHLRVTVAQTNLKTTKK